VAGIEHLSPSAASYGRPARAAIAAPQAFAPGELDSSSSIIIPRLRATRAAPFLAQYIAQELSDPAEPAPRWRERDSAYRAAAADSPETSLSIEA
jgi:hypothetical protein